VDLIALRASDLRDNCEKMVKHLPMGKIYDKVSPMVKVPDKDEGSR
jgi:hypothetical protein